jgi:hypothetical protein
VLHSATLEIFTTNKCIHYIYYAFLKIQEEAYVLQTTTSVRDYKARRTTARNRKSNYFPSLITVCINSFTCIREKREKESMHWRRKGNE